MYDTLRRFLTLCSRRDDARTPLAAVSLHLTVRSARTISWRVVADAEIRVSGARVWLTHAGSVHDYWLIPGDFMRVRRGERIWLSTDSECEATVTLTYRHVRARRPAADAELDGRSAMR